jgi:NAD(P)H dehydrogenase (quinone)
MTRATVLAYGLLAGRKCLLITVSEAPLPRLVNSGNWNAAQTLREPHFVRGSGFELLAHLHFSGIVPNLSTSATDQCLVRVQYCIWEHFSTRSGAMAEMTRTEEDIAPIWFL